MTYRNILLNCVLLNTVFFCSANASYRIGENLYDDVQLNIDEEITLDSMNLTQLTMSDTGSLILNGGGYIDDATFSGAVSDIYSTTSEYPLTLFSTKTTFDNVDIDGSYNPNKNAVTWGDQTSFWSNELVMTGDVTINNAQVGVSSEPIKDASWFSDVENFNPAKSDYAANTPVVWNGGVYLTGANQGAFSDMFYSDLASKTDPENGTLVRINGVDQFTPFVGIGKSYSNGDVFQVMGTNEFLESVGLIDEYPEGQGSTMRILAFLVTGDMNTLKPEDIMTEQTPPINYKSGITMNGANVVLSRTSVMAHQEITPLQRFAMGQEFEQILARLHELSPNMSEEDSTFILNRLDELDLSNGPDEFWNRLREYYYDPDNDDNPDIMQAYEDVDAIHTEYLKRASIAESLPVTIKDSNVVAGNSSIQKHDSGDFIIDNSTVTLYGWQDSIMPEELGGSKGHLNHSGATGDIIIRNNSVLNLYPHSNLHRETESKGNIYVIGSTINLRGSDTHYTENIEDGASLSVNNGNIQLTQGSVLNAYGDDNGVMLPNLAIDFETKNWQEKVKAKSLYVNNSTINVMENSSLETGVDSEDDDALGTIAMDVNSVINVHGVLGADIVSLNTDTDAGVVNLYNGAYVEGNIRRANVFVNPGAEHKKVNVYGRLSLLDSTLDIGTNTLNFQSIDALLKSKYGENYITLFDEDEIDITDPELITAGFLHLNNSTIVTHINFRNNTNGKINVEKLEFGDTPSVVKIVVDDGVLKPQGVTVDFLTGDTEIGDNLIFSNVMYNITYNNGMLTLVPNGNTGIISLEALNDRLAATSWLSNGFADGSVAKMIADTLNEWAQTDPETFKKAIKQVQPNTTPSQQATSRSTNNQIVNAVNRHNRENSNSHNSGKHGGHDAKGEQHQGRSGGDVFENNAVWAQGLYNKSKLDTTGGFNGNTYGFALGTDTEVNDNLVLGLGYAYTNSDIDTESRDTDVDSHTAILYGQYDFSDAFVSGIATYGFSRYEEESDMKTAKYNMDSIFAQATTGYNFYVDSLTLTPETGLKYLWTNTHGYTDSAEQHIAGNNTNTLTGVLGGSVSMELQSGDFVFKPSAMVLATYDMVKDTDSINVILANGSSYAVSNSGLNRFGTELGIGLDMNYNTFDLSLNYGIEIRENYTSQTGMLKAKYNF